MKILKILLSVLLTATFLSLSAQDNKIIKGKVLNENGQPVLGAFISVSGISSVQTNEEGKFELTTDKTRGTLRVWADGYYEYTQPISERNEISIVLTSTKKINYSDVLIMPFHNENIDGKTSSAVNISKKDFKLGSMHVEDAFTGKFAGLRVVGKSGMPSEGSYLNFRGIRSLVAENSPLIVINGVPYFPDMSESPLIGGYSRSIFNNYNINDFQNITLLKGADAAIYGSLGSNGVILIETDGASSDELDTRITFSGQYGVSFKNKTLPLLGVSEFKTYLSDIGTTYYQNMADLTDRFPFLIDDPNDYYRYMYNSNTNWQKEIFSPAFVTDNLLRIEGGDAVAKYDVSVGYFGEGGTLGDTKTDRYTTQINTNLAISRKVEMFTTVGMAYIENKLQEQGMLSGTNPMLAAYIKNPNLSPYQRNAENRNLVAYDTVRYGISNPVAITNTLEAENRVYDINLRVGLSYRPLDNLYINGIVGLYYNYNRERVFIPGYDNSTIVLNNRQAYNVVRVGVAEALNMFYNINAGYNKTFNDIHKLNVLAGGQILKTRREYDAGEGYNTTNDFYKTLDGITNKSTTLKFFGYIDLWNWMNYYVHSDYTYNNLVRGSVNVAFDAASSTGVDATRFGVFPSAALTLMAKNLQPLQNTTFLNKFDIRAEYGLTGNSRFSSNYGKDYYVSSLFSSISGIVKGNIPNTNLKWENHAQLNLGFDLSLLRNRIDLSFDYYNIQSKDVLFNRDISSVYGFDIYYDNTAKLENKGVEIALQAAIIKTQDFDWIIGGNISFLKSKIKSLGNGVTEKITTYDDGLAIISRVGDKPYQFYGLQTDGILTTSTAASIANLSTLAGNAYEAGDIRYVDQNNDNIIDTRDYVPLGSAQPKYFGGFYGTVRYKNFILTADFTYSQGNKAYNAVRRTLESMSDFDNQSVAVLNRWQVEGQITDMPRATYGDPVNNSGFSSRWIEDASYLKLKNITLSYNFEKTFLKVFRSGTLYVTGENLVTWTKYLGLDPEFAYSYDEMRQGCDFAKVPLAKSVRFGLNLKF